MIDEAASVHMAAPRGAESKRCLEERKGDQEKNAHRARVLYTRVLREFGSTEWARKAADRG